MILCMWTSERTSDTNFDLILGFENFHVFHYLILIYLSKLIIKIIFEKIIFRDGVIITRPNFSNIEYKEQFYNNLS